MNLEAHQFREWEKRDWLGEIVKDPRQNQQRIFTEEQVERIQLIAQRFKLSEQKESSGRTLKKWKATSWKGSEEK